MSDESLYNKLRPNTLDGLVGQPEAVRILQSKISKGNLPHAILLSGPSGCGKTTIAMILKNHLECGDLDFETVQAADSRGIDMVRDIRERKGRAPISGKCRIWLIDECHQMTKEAQNSFLDMLEFTPSHVYFFLATTDPSKLLKTIHTRCMEVKVKLIGVADMKKLLADSAKAEKYKLSVTVTSKIIDIAEGSARKALVLLESILGIKDELDQIEALEKSDSRRQMVEVFKALMFPRTTWPEMCKVLKNVEDEPEGVRRYVLACAGSTLLGAGKMASRAFLIVQAFRDNFFDCGRAGLIAACYEVITSK